jgi:hypothetical protein
MSKQTTLAESQITQTPHDVVTVELVKPDDMPAVIRISWPLHPTVCDPRRLPQLASDVARMFAEASTTLAGIKRRRRL